MSKATDILALVKEAKKLPSWTDKDMLDILSNNFTVDVKIKDIKSIGYYWASKKKLVLEDFGGQLGHMHVLLIDKDLEITFPPRYQVPTLPEVESFLRKNGARLVMGYGR